MPLRVLRADTITSLRIKHLVLQSREIAQDGRKSRTKNGKSLWVKSFPLPPLFERVVSEWKNELVELGYGPDDALFPDHRCLLSSGRPFDPNNVWVMQSIHAISVAFKLTSNLIEMSFPPHSAKRCIGQLSWIFCMTAEQRKAWSENMGHDDEDVTQKYYSNISANRISEIFDAFGEGGRETDEDTELMLLYHEHELSKGTSEFARAKRLVDVRRNKSRSDVDPSLIEPF